MRRRRSDGRGLGTERLLWEPSAPPERTYQSWTRTALALVACALLATRLAVQVGEWALVVPAATMVAALALVRWQKRRLGTGRHAPDPHQLLALTVVVVALAAACLALVLLSGARG